MDTKIIKKLDEIIKNMVTKADLKTELAKYATKDDLKKELENFATKDDLAAIKKELMVYISEGEVAIISGVEKHVVGRLDILENRVGKIEHQLQQT